MKRINKYILLAFIGASVIAGCTKKNLIDLSPDFILDAVTNPSSIEQVEEVLAGAYTQIRSGSYYGDGSGSGWSLMPDMMSDNLLEINESLSNYNRLTDWTYDADVALVTGMWEAPYKVIAHANIVLRDIDKFTTPNNQQKANRLKGQAYALRAHAHFDLFRFFAPVYTRNSTTDLAVPYVTDFNVSPALRPGRLNNKDFYDKLFSDLTSAVQLLTNVDANINPSAIKRPNVDLAGAKAIQARAYLYAGMWTEAIQAATDVIALRPITPVTGNFAGMYNEATAGEIIWNAQFDANQGGPGGGTYFSQNNRSAFRPAADVATMAGITGLIQNTDIRYNAYFRTITGPNAVNRLVVSKYRGKGTLTDGNANFPIYRTGEMYLILAEAKARNTPAQEAQALADLNTLRSNRFAVYVPLVGLTGQTLLNAIADERRRELFAEGHRFFDLKRTTRQITRTGDCGNVSLSPAGSCSLAPTAREWALPIPTTETNVNTTIRAQQNPGY